MRKNCSFFIAGSGIMLLLASGCKKESCAPGPPLNTNPVKFDQLAVGQVSHYIGLLGENYFENGAGTFTYTDDTLVIEVVSRDAHGYKIAESLRYVGDIDPWMGFERDSVYTYYLNVRNDSLIVSPIGTDYLKSRIMGYPFQSAGLSLLPVSGPKVNLTGWKTDLSYCECFREGYVENYTLFGTTYDRLNVVIDNSPMALDGNGATYVYAPDHGIVRFSTYGWWTQSGYGWDLLGGE